jgi:hypothetical protein
MLIDERSRPRKPAWLRPFVVVRCRAPPLSNRLPKPEVAGSIPVVRFALLTTLEAVTTVTRSGIAR